MPSKTKQLTGKQLLAYEATRDLAADLLESVRQMKTGKVQVVVSPAIEARERTGFRDGSKVASSPVARRVPF
jgi:putative transcriptional regulator